MKEYLIEGNTIPEAYHKALIHLHNDGKIYDCTAWNCQQKEITATLYVKHPLKEPMISKLSICGQRELQSYMMEMLDGIKDFEIDKGNWTYTYHDRFKNQLPFIISELKKDESSRRAVMSIRNDTDIGSSDPACWQHCQYFIRDNKLHCKVLFRSNDACKATFMNMFALVMLQKKVADELGIEVGSYTHRANSFHCYSQDFDMLKGYISRIKNIHSNEYRDLLKLAYSYEGNWKEDMDDYISEILEEVEELKKR